MSGDLDPLVTAAKVPMFVRRAAEWVLPGGRRGRLSILIYHRVLSAPDPLCSGDLDATAFATQLRILAENFNVLPLGEAVQRLKRRSLPARAAAITFDDGYADNHNVALPLLRRFGLPATFFVATGYLDGGRMWNDTIIEAVRRTDGAELELTELGLGRHSVATVDDRKRTIAALIRGLKYAPTTERSALVERIQEKAGQSLPNDLMMSAEQVRSLRRAGMEIGGHTVSHPILARLDARDARAEIAAGKDRIEQLLGERISLFAYPNGRPQEDFTAEHVWLVRQLGFDAAVTTAWGAADGRSDLFQLPRFTPWDRTPIRFVARMMRSALRGRARTAEPARDRRPTQDA